MFLLIPVVPLTVRSTEVEQRLFYITRIVVILTLNDRYCINSERCPEGFFGDISFFTNLCDLLCGIAILAVGFR